MAFYLGPLVFGIKNKYLIIPFPRGERLRRLGLRPVRPSRSGIVRRRAEVRFLQIPLSWRDSSEPIQSFVAPVTLGYKQNYSRTKDRPMVLWPNH